MSESNSFLNNFSISTDQLATGLKDSAAALSTAGNDINESIALITAGNTITQNASKTGAGLRTISLRMAGTEAAKAELEDIGEDTSDFVVQTKSKIDEQLRQFTAVGSNNYKGVSMLSDDGTYKSTYEVLQDIADIYDEIVESDKKFGTNKANGLLELLAGKTRANIAGSILQNPEILRSAYEQVQNAEGSAEAENEKYLDSIDGKIQQIKNRAQELAFTTIDSEMFKNLIDAGTQFLELLNNIISTAGLLPTVLGVGGIGAFAKSIPWSKFIGRQFSFIKMRVAHASYKYKWHLSASAGAWRASSSLNEIEFTTIRSKCLKLPTTSSN